MSRRKRQDASPRKTNILRDQIRKSGDALSALKGIPFCIMKEGTNLRALLPSAMHAFFPQHEYKVSRP
jgi:hypothetical protein